MSTMNHAMTAEDVVKWIEEHVTEIRQIGLDSLDPEQFEVTWIDKHNDLHHVSRCQNLTKLAKQYHDQ